MASRMIKRAACGGIGLVLYLHGIVGSEGNRLNGLLRVLWVDVASSSKCQTSVLSGRGAAGWACGVRSLIIAHGKPVALPAARTAGNSCCRTGKRCLLSLFRPTPGLPLRLGSRLLGLLACWLGRQHRGRLCRCDMGGDKASGEACCGSGRVAVCSAGDAACRMALVVYLTGSSGVCGFTS
jgi:hypothetical protein